MPSRRANSSKLSTANKNETTSSKGSGQLRKEDHIILINWLKVSQNYNACFGDDKETRVGRPPSSKVNGYQLMANELKKKTKGRLDLNSKQMRE